VILDDARIVTEAGVVDGAIVVDGETITAVGADALSHRPSTVADDRVRDLGGRWVLPGFVDLHTHGGGGGGYPGGDVEAALRAVEFHRAHGTTTSVASLVSAPVEQLERDIAALAELVRDGVLAGIHLEGPFISRHRRGAHDPAVLREPDARAVDRLLAAGAGAVRMITLAPELAGGIDAVRRVTDAGAVAAVGHTDAEYAVAKRAFDAGASVATHLFNGMRPFGHREPGPALAALDSEWVTVELINDGDHLHPAVVRDVFRALGGSRVAFITDAISAAGLPDGVYPLGSMRVRVADGRAVLADSETGARAGSTLTMDAALRRAVLDDGLPIVAVSAALSGTPARVLGLADRLGSITVGKRADLVVLDEHLSVVDVLWGGRWVRVS
jgi:N-acetylglucosamine-6-phosphate deacetylase